MSFSNWTIVKKASIIGFIVGEILMFWVFLAPFRPQKPGRMIIPESMIPKAAPEEIGKPVPWEAQIQRLAVGAVFFGPFGAFAGLGVGLLLQGAIASLRRRTTTVSPANVEQGPTEVH
jgi:hypothetical protein